MKQFFRDRSFLSRSFMLRLLAAGLLLIGAIAFLVNSAFAASNRILPPGPNALFPGDTATVTLTATATDTSTPTGTVTATVTATASSTPSTTPTATGTPITGSLPRFDHVVVVIEENKDYSELIGPNSPATYINSLVAKGVLFTNSHGITHPSQPNYLDLFSGSDQGVNGDACSSSTVYPAPDLGGQLISAGFTFAGYSESMPSAGYTGCYDTPTTFGSIYARKHNPWANFSDVSGPSTNLTFSSFPTTATGFSALPTVSFVVPNLQDDMHDGTIQQGDSWLQQNMGAYITWATTHNSLLILTTDESDTTNGSSTTNQIATIFVGQHVQAGVTNNTNISHFNILRTLEDMYGLTPANNAATATDITGIWN